MDLVKGFFGTQSNEGRENTSELSQTRTAITVVSENGATAASPAETESLSHSTTWDWLSTVSGSFRDRVENVASTLQHGAAEMLDDIKDKDVKNWLGAREDSAKTRLPWDNLEEFADAIERSNYSADQIGKELKSRILAVSIDPDTFSKPPPPSFEFSMQEKSGLALSLLEADIALERERYDKVPRLMKEEAFWRTYFWKVSESVENMWQEIIEGNLQPKVLPSDVKVLNLVEEKPRTEPAATSEVPAVVERKNSLDEALEEFYKNCDSSEDEGDGEKVMQEENLNNFEKKWFGESAPNESEKQGD